MAPVTNAIGFVTFVVFSTFLFSNGQSFNATRPRIIFRNGRGRISTLGDEHAKRELFLATSRHYEGGKKGTAPGMDTIRVQTISQRLDHFDGTNPKTWSQTYWMNGRYYKKGGPIFLYISGGGADPYWIGGSGVLPDWLVKAKKFEALCFYLEHRYYGDSRPTPNLSIKNLKYMNTYQALSDIANFIVNITTTYNLGNAPWVLFGCSYAGSLAAWARMKYPHLVSVAVASGAPLEAKLDFSEYAEVVTKVLQKERKGCAEDIASATSTLEKWIRGPDMIPRTKRMFSICEDEYFNPNDKLNMSVFFAHLAENIFNVVQYDKANVGTGKDNLTVSAICATLGDSKLGDYVTRYAAIHRLILSAYEKPCLSISYSGLVQSLKHPGYEDDWRQWSFQACNEFGFHPTSNSPYQPFGHRFDLEYYLQQCKDIFGVPVDKSQAQENIDETQRQYGGRNAQFSRTIFTYGTNDPWYPLTAAESFRSLKVITIEGGSHCAEFYTPDDTSDSKEVISARRQVDRLLKRWIENANAGNRTTLPYMAGIITLSVVFVLGVLLCS